MTIQHTVNQINSAAAQNIPFLFAFDFELKEGLFIENPLMQKEILFRTPQGSNFTPTKSLKKHTFSRFPLPYETYQKAFNIVSQGLYRGDSYLTNLTLQTPIETNLTLQDILYRSNSPYALYIPSRFVCFSPECFIKIDEFGGISTFPMKGTISSQIPHAKEKILQDIKETAEHTTVVDLLRNDIGIIAENIEVKRFRFISEIETKQGNILQVSSEIVGQLPSDYRLHLGDILLKMLPAGSVSGAPKKSTLEIIARAEQQPRGFYTGVFGYFDGQTLESAVLIRYIEQINKQLFFRSGGGITVMSNCQSEYQEIIDKIYLPFL